MEIIYAMAIGILAGSGTWLLLRPRTFQVIIGLTLLSYAVNLFIFSMGSLNLDRAPIIDPMQAVDPARYADPVPQALVLTAIVIGFAMTAFVILLALKARAELGTDQVDGEAGHD